MKKIGYYIGAAALVLASFSSCTLESVNYTEKDQTNFPQTETDQAQALAAIYQNLNKVNANPQYSWFYVAQLASDDALGGGGENDILMQAEDLMAVSQTDMTEQFWKDRYEGIMRANTLLDALNEKSNAQTRGEALFLRAYYYYELASMYGNIPLTTTSQKVEPIQATAAQIWGQILQDLYTAATIMPSIRRTDGHVDKYCAEGMLGRCWLYYTGMYCNGEDLSGLTSTNYSPLTEVDLPDGTKLTKQMVIDCLNDCLTSGYKLVPDFRNLWAYTNRCTVNDYPYTSGAKDKDGNALKWVEDDEAGKTNDSQTERMFAIKFNKQASWSTTIGYANGYALHFGVRGTACFPFGAGWGAGPVAPNLVSDWKATEPNDVRLNATVQNMQELDGFALGGGGDFIQETGYYDKKLSPIEAKKSDGTISVCFENLMYSTDNWTSGAENLQLNNIHDLVLMRYAEVLLMHSELTETTTGINEVRARAGLPAIGSYSLQALQNERRWELAFEGLRWNDIRRWHIAAAALDKQTGTKIYNKGIETTNTRSGFSYSARYNATAGFQKKPENQVNLSEGGIQQNPGWDDASSTYTKW